MSNLLSWHELAWMKLVANANERTVVPEILKRSSSR